jgi:hypothetical protein
MTPFSNPDLSAGRTSSRRRPKYLFEWSLRPWWRAMALLLGVIALSILLTYETTRVALATGPVDSISIPAVQKGLAHDPGNSALLHQLGLLYASSPTEMNPAEALKCLRQAVTLNPHRWEYWTDLAIACDSAGDTACSDQAFERARALNPLTPRLQWVIGNHYVLTDRVQAGFPYFRRFLQAMPEYAGPTFRLCLRATGDPQQVYREVIPQAPDSTLRFSFLTYLCDTGDYESAMRIWGQMIAGPDHPPGLLAVKPFLDFLLEHDEIRNATTVWEDLQRRGLVAKETTPESGNLVYNGSFERQPLNIGFDWRYDEGSDLVFDFSDPQAYQGGRCLRIEFPVGRNQDYDLVSQVVPVVPSTRYQLTAYVRSADLISDSGPRLRVIQLGCPNCAISTSDQTLGTTKWHPVDVIFTTPPQTQAVRISFWRPPGRTVPRDISGTVWLDEVDLRAADIPGRSGALDRYR